MTVNDLCKRLDRAQLTELLQDCLNWHKTGRLHSTRLSDFCVDARTTTGFDGLDLRMCEQALLLETARRYVWDLKA